MRSEWLQYGALLAIVFCMVNVTGRAQDIIAQDVVQNREASESEVDDLKMQLKKMEEAFLVQQKMMKEH